MARFSQIWAELDHAQTRLLEIRTGLELSPRTPSKCNIVHLEALYALPSAAEPDLTGSNRCAP